MHCACGVCNVNTPRSHTHTRTPAHSWSELCSIPFHRIQRQKLIECVQFIPNSDAAALAMREMYAIPIPTQQTLVLAEWFAVAVVDLKRNKPEETPIFNRRRREIDKLAEPPPPSLVVRRLVNSICQRITFA